MGSPLLQIECWRQHRIVVLLERRTPRTENAGRKATQDEFVKSHDGDDEVKSSRGKARES